MLTYTLFGAAVIAILVAWAFAEPALSRRTVKEYIRRHGGRGARRV